MKKIIVWEYDMMSNYWKKNITDDNLESYDEEKYFRVIRNNNKEFYYSKEDYCNHLDLEIEKLSVIN